MAKFHIWGCVPVSMVFCAVAPTTKAMDGVVMNVKTMRLHPDETIQLSDGGIAWIFNGEDAKLFLDMAMHWWAWYPSDVFLYSADETYGGYCGWREDVTLLKRI